MNNMGAPATDLEKYAAVQETAEVVEEKVEATEEVKVEETVTEEVPAEADVDDFGDEDEGIEPAEAAPAEEN